MASGDRLATFIPPTGSPAATAAAVVGFRAGASSHLIPYWEFADGATETLLDFTEFLKGYGSGGLTVTLVWMAATATTGNVKWNVAFKSMTDDVDDIDTKAYATAQTTTDTTATGAGKYAYTTVTFTDGAQMDSVADGELFHMRVSRDSNPAGDTMTDVAQIVGIMVAET